MAKKDGKSKSKKSNQKKKSNMGFKMSRMVKLQDKGYISLWRRLPEIYLTNTSINGAVQLTDPTGSCLQLGTPTLTQMGTYDVPFSMVFKISQLINYTDLLNLADAYKIKCVEIKIYYNSNTNSVNSSASLPQLTYIQDHDDATVPATVTALREKSGLKYKFFNSKNFVKIRVYPRISNVVFNTGITNAYSPATKSQWVDSAYINTEHYGIKGVINNFSLPANTGGIQVGFKYDINVLVAGKDFQ